MAHAHLRAFDGALRLCDVTENFVWILKAKLQYHVAHTIDVVLASASINICGKLYLSNAESIPIRQDVIEWDVLSAEFLNARK